MNRVKNGSFNPMTNSGLTVNADGQTDHIKTELNIMVKQIQLDFFVFCP